MVISFIKELLYCIYDIYEWIKFFVKTQWPYLLLLLFAIAGFICEYQSASFHDRMVEIVEQAIEEPPTK